MIAFIVATGNRRLPAGNVLSIFALIVCRGAAG
jgi:hypothetical protein